MKWFSTGLAVIGLTLNALGGCGDVSSDDLARSLPPGNVSGQRLRARWFDVDGQREPHGWYDTQLDMDCAFYAVRDEYRCVPAEGYLAHLAPDCSDPPVLVGFGGRTVYSRLDWGMSSCNPYTGGEIVRAGTKLSAPEQYFVGSDCCVPRPGPSLAYANDTAFRDADCTEPLLSPTECTPNPQFAQQDPTNEYFAITGIDHIEQTYYLKNGECSPIDNPTDAFRLERIPASDFVEVREVTE